MPFGLTGALATFQHWLSKLASFDFDVKYRQAKHNNNADALSRMYDKLEPTRSEDAK